MPPANLWLANMYPAKAGPGSSFLNPPSADPNPRCPRGA
ncbi:protein of unassigned function [Methylobacterium oryzae CBMB20]|uniref:Protein of unassigned function n=1 Tax=Methylobacterium oryzae CBMB20 TaxID=693986 RepID=A0A089NZX9_9HYPH|nr:protein of unassigned function [Methylobacterium oryzae CBMB20]